MGSGMSPEAPKCCNQGDFRKRPNIDGFKASDRRTLKFERTVVSSRRLSALAGEREGQDHEVSGLHDQISGHTQSACPTSCRDVDVG